MRNTYYMGDFSKVPIAQEIYDKLTRQAIIFQSTIRMPSYEDSEKVDKCQLLECGINVWLRKC